MDSVEKPGFCTLCRSRCGTVNVVQGGRLVEVRAQPGHPTGSAICPKGRAGPEIAHDARRLTQPLRRTAPKGSADPGWQPIGWDEALGETAAQLSRLRDLHGAESVAFMVTSPSATALSDSVDWVFRLIRRFGSPNTAYATEICNWHKDHAHAFTFGCGIPTPDYDRADLMLLWGHNPAASWLAQASRIAAARARGARLAVIDPRQAGLARDADLWLRVRPGTDGALALGLARLLLEWRAYDDAFLRRWSNGPFLVGEDGRFLRDGSSHLVWDEAAGAPVPAGTEARAALFGRFTVAGQSCRTAMDHYAGACAPFTPEEVERHTTIPADQVVALAREIAAAHRVCYYGWTGVGQHANATQTERAMALLYALTGSFDQPGGNVRLAAQPTNPVNTLGLFPPGQLAKALGATRLPLGPPADGWVTSRDLYTAILERDPYPVRALVGFGGNILVSQPDAGRGRAALAALEFQVHCDHTLTPTAAMADIVLPVNSPYEREGLRIGFEIDHAAQELIQLRQPMIPPQSGARSEMQIVFDLAVRLGLGDEFFDGDIDAAWNHQLAPAGVTVAELRRHPEGIRRPLAPRTARHEAEGFATETGKVEIYSERLLRHGADPVPRFRPPADGPDNAYPLVLFSFNSGYFCHSQHRNVPSLRRRAPYPTVHLHPDLARAEGVGAGDWVRVRTRVGQVRLRAALDPALAPGTVASEYGWWQACDDLGLPGGTSGITANFNDAIADDARDPVSGAIPLRSFACSIELDTATGWPGDRPFHVAARVQEAADVVSLTLSPVDRGPVPVAAPGQHIGLQLPEGFRAYSLSSGPGSPYRVTVRGVEGGAVSPALGRLQAGDTLGVRPPSGSFTLPLRNDFPVVLVAGGIGVTPFVAYLEALQAVPDPPEVVLYYGCRDAGSRAFAGRLAELARPGVRIVSYLSRPAPADERDHEGRITAASIDPALLARRARFYLCGPDAMMDDVAAGLRHLGVPAFEIFRERFGAAPQAVPQDGATHRVRFARSGLERDWTAASGTLLALAEAAGLSPPGGCRTGQCENCAVAVLSGQVLHLVPVADVEGGACLACQAVPLSDLQLDL